MGAAKSQRPRSATPSSKAEKLRAPTRPQSAKPSSNPLTNAAKGPPAAGTEEAALDDFCKVLDEHRKQCEASAKYQEADVAMNRLNELRLHEENRQRQALRAKHIAERVRVEEAHTLEFNQFNAEWDRRMAEYDQKAAELEEAMKERQNEDLSEFRRKMAAAAVRPRFSSDLLNMRKIQETLAKQKEYAEAHKVKLKADALEARELAKWNVHHQGRIGAQEDKHVYKQMVELEALQKRVLAGSDEHKRQRQADLHRILQRYQNVKTALEKQQTKETASRERAMKLKAQEMGIGLVHEDPPIPQSRVPGSKTPYTTNTTKIRPASARSKRATGSPLRATLRQSNGAM
ncbi:hypothetical protein CYMTET_3471 [Cymbomonas tetramitiformis]|uniref:Uncharacterized protein n=1 Tax=Cymbomonas tetramitiformis TaxID=36881 RepID=A0AAE0LL06_9CHLO|nr:hypothetical protein CYMTET_3471 [Cymbomonas tetramitiformis]